jgi:mono/diheme cytochrome c family protein
MRIARHYVVATGALALAVLPLTAVGAADPAAVARGKYLVTLTGCNDCHTPGYFLGKPEMARFLGGSEVGFEMPGLGVFHGPNLTPDKATGLGNWADAQIVTAIQQGKRPDGRTLAPIMPSRLCYFHQAGHGFDRGVPAQPAAGRQQGAWPVRSDRDADLLRHEDRAAAGEVVSTMWFAH